MSKVTYVDRHVGVVQYGTTFTRLFVCCFQADQEECGAEFQPVVKLEEVEVFSGEEGEDMWLDYKCKLYRLDGQEWKERGLGQVSLFIFIF